ncbi:MAG: PRC-barrel domain-containing protein [Silicimonas sp.]|nr:PRC-barrel domain-containing protein [Silicimonas sp.]
MSMKTKLLTTAAAISLVAGGAYAENHTAAEGENMSANAEVNVQTNYPAGWNDDLDQRYAAIADRPVRDLIGINVVTEGGDDVGEIDTFVILENELMAVVGVGGFLGLGEHEVALSLKDLTWDGDRMVIPFTEEELEAMPEWTEEADFAALTETDTFRSRGDLESVGDRNDELGATQLADNPDAVELDEDVAEAANETEQAVEETAAATEEAVEEGAAETEQMAENAAEATENAAEEAGDEVADAADATGDAMAEGAEAVEQTAENAATAVGNWFEQIEAEFGELADANIIDVEGREVANANGEIIGEVEEVAMMDGKPVAVIGVGGFLGLGDHDVALELTELKWNGETFVLDGYTEAQLKEMSQVDPDAIEMLEDDTTLRSHANM